MSLKNKISSAITEIKELYLQDGKPWVIGYSGGKDSTTVLQLVYRSLMEIPIEQRHKDVHVVSSDTLVEPPYILDYLNRTLSTIEGNAKENNLPIIVKKVSPDLNDSFFVNVIGKGYPAPNRWFRWCTERLKISPTNRYIKQQISKKGSVIVLLGARKEESASRAQVMSNHEQLGSRLRRHSTLEKALIYTPIENWSTEEVWLFLDLWDAPWGSDNRELAALYKDASGGECPLVIDTSTPSCGTSRFGCWVCTVVDQDKSMEGFIESGQEQMQPLLEFRNWLKDIRDDLDMRESRRRSGQEGPGPFKKEIRQEILRRLLETQKVTGYTLISTQELDLIQSYWLEDGMSATSAQEIFEEVSDRPAYSIKSGNYLNEKELSLLEGVLAKRQIDPNVVMRLLDIEFRMRHMKRRRGLLNEIDTVIKSAVTVHGEDVI